MTEFSRLNPLAVYLKDPSARLDYTVDWSPVFGPADPVASATWAITPSGSLSEDGNSVSGSYATVILQGGTEGVTYDVTCTATSQGGFVDEQTIRVIVQQR